MLISLLYFNKIRAIALEEYDNEVDDNYKSLNIKLDKTNISSRSSSQNTNIGMRRNEKPPQQTTNLIESFGDIFNTGITSNQPTTTPNITIPNIFDATPTTTPINVFDNIPNLMTTQQKTTTTNDQNDLLSKLGSVNNNINII
jgi:isocitrate dehydrogenase